MGTDNFIACGKYNLPCAQEENQKHMDDGINDSSQES